MPRSILWSQAVNTSLFLRTHLANSLRASEIPLCEMFLPLLLATVAVAAGIYFVLSSSVRSLRRKLIQKETGVADVPFLGISRPEDRKIQGTAVVCGGRLVWSSVNVELSFICRPFHLA
jgi:hypothetical protein